MLKGLKNEDSRVARLEWHEALATGLEFVHCAEPRHLARIRTQAAFQSQGQHSYFALKALCELNGNAFSIHCQDGCDIWTQKCPAEIKGGLHAILGGAGNCETKRHSADN